MKIRNTARKVCVVFTVTAVMMYYSGFGINTVLCKETGASAKARGRSGIYRKNEIRSPFG